VVLTVVPLNALIGEELVVHPSLEQGQLHCFAHCSVGASEPEGSCYRGIANAVPLFLGKDYDS
jgi:hypothetical protein